MKSKIIFYILYIIEIIMIIHYKIIYAYANSLSSEPKIIETKFYNSDNFINELPYFPNEEKSSIEISGINFNVKSYLKKDKLNKTIKQ